MEKSILQIPFKVIRNYQRYLRSQNWSKNSLSYFQDQKLIQLVKHANKNVPYYQNLFKKIKFDARTFRGRIDLPKIPILEKETVRKSVDKLLAKNATKYGIRWDSTSGSTGTPLHFVLDDQVQANKIAALLRSYCWAGYKFYTKTLSVQSYYFVKENFKYNPFFNVLRFDTNRLCKNSVHKLLVKLKSWQPDLIMGFPFDILMIAKIGIDFGLELPTPKMIITYGETLSCNQRTQLSKFYHSKVYDFYSMHENSAMISQCESGNLHLIEDFAYHEILDENDKHTSTGDLIGTNYYNYAMPLIRYRTLDKVELSNSASCKCGRNFRIVKEIFGKACDFIETPDGRILGSVMSHSIDQAKGIIASQCIQDKIDHIYTNLIIDKEFDSNSLKNLKIGLRKRIGNEMKIDINFVKNLKKRQSGKTPFIISKIGNKYQE
ncbi:MAG: hypothetical protein K8S23_10760 [Candidatus Cloacimonetes bacterium]|nr:hypothetical protein [Candidatus Cloacimonadota bacterium]